RPDGDVALRGADRARARASGPCRRGRPAARGWQRASREHLPPRPRGLGRPRPGDPIGMTTAPPKYSGRLTKVTGEGEQVEIAFIANTPDELTARLAAVGAAPADRLNTNNDAIVKARG